jgi:hypothetical protein
MCELFFIKARSENVGNAARRSLPGTGFARVPVSKEYLFE